jgi:hypothetical protein
MRAMKQVSLGTLICGATLLVMGSASALPLGAGQAQIGAAAENAASGLIIQTQCGPGGCGPGGGNRVPQGPRRHGGGGGGGTTGWGGAGIGLGLDLLQQQLESGPLIGDNPCKRPMMREYWDGTRIRCLKK